jgi:hypothetical protein
MRWFVEESDRAQYLGTTKNLNESHWREVLVLCVDHTQEGYHEIAFTREVNYRAMKCRACPDVRGHNSIATDAQRGYIASLVRSFGRENAIAFVEERFPKHPARYLLNNPNRNEASILIERFRQAKEVA